MTAVYLTIDTEYSSDLARRLGPNARSENFDRSIACRVPDGEVGIHYQMDVMDASGLKGIFFVDPMPSVIWGIGAVADVVEPILKRGHEVQLHLHPEWLEIAGDANPIRGRTGRNMRDFTEEEQIDLLELGREWLVQAGAPSPIAFRAGNYGANDATLRALKQVGIRYDSSHVPGIEASECAISLGPNDRKVVRHQGTLEVPVGSVRSFRGQRHAQITALSIRELRAALRYAVSQRHQMLNIVSHSFELLSRDRKRANIIVRDRFTKFCEAVASTAGAQSATFVNRPPQIGDTTGAGDMPHNEIRRVARVAEQVVSNALFGRT